MSEQWKCPSCQSDLAQNAVLCIQCGYDLRSKEKLSTDVSGGTPLPSSLTGYTDDSGAALSGVNHDYDISSYHSLKKERRLFLILQFAFGVPGILLQMSLIEPLMVLGFIPLIIGLSFYAKYKGHSGLNGLWGLLSCIGLIAVALLPDNNRVELKNLKGRLTSEELRRPNG